MSLLKFFQKYYEKDVTNLQVNEKFIDHLSEKLFSPKKNYSIKHTISNLYTFMKFPMKLTGAATVLVISGFALIAPSQFAQAKDSIAQLFYTEDGRVKDQVELTEEELNAAQEANEVHVFTSPEGVREIGIPIQSTKEKEEAVKIEKFCAPDDLEMDCSTDIDYDKVEVDKIVTPKIQ